MKSIILFIVLLVYGMVSILAFVSGLYVPCRCDLKTRGEILVPTYRFGCYLAEVVNE